jgi:hypothetical protein
MPELCRRVLALAVALALVPAAAFAQGAGDDQYEDPFGDEQQEQATPAPTPQAPAATATPVPAQPAPTTAPPSSTPAPEDTLPYTGIDGWPVAIAGAILLGAGITLRVRADRGA